MAGVGDATAGGSVLMLTSTFVSVGLLRERKRMKSADAGTTVKQMTIITTSRTRRVRGRTLS
jgi:hypothetical protein